MTTGISQLWGSVRPAPSLSLPSPPLPLLRFPAFSSRAWGSAAEPQAARKLRPTPDAPERFLAGRAAQGLVWRTQPPPSLAAEGTTLGRPGLPGACGLSQEDKAPVLGPPG